VFVFASGDGFLVYSVCSHPPTVAGAGVSDGPFHAIDLVQAHIEDGSLPAGPIHTLVTGACGMGQVVRERGAATPDHAGSSDPLFRSALSTLKARTGLRRVYLIHCALSSFEHTWPIFMEVFGDDVRRAVPGSAIPL
jgi:hypothetical protein